jgi:hypothetical protein
MHELGFGGLRAEALFASGLQRCDDPGPGQVRQAIAAALRALDCCGCAGRVAQEFGDHPETALLRMRWARAVAGAAFADSAQQPGEGADAGWLRAVRAGLPADQVAGSSEAGRREQAVFLAGRAAT